MTKLADIIQSPRITDGAKANDLTLSTDVCIIGSGAGGAVTAAVLAEAGRDVLILEHGGYYTHQNFTMDEADVYPKLYQDDMRRATVDLGVTILQGRAVGGTTVVNFTTCFRTPEDVVSHWKLGGFRYADLVPEWEWIEKRLCIAEVNDGLINRNNRTLADGCKALGWQVAPLKRNVYACMNSGFCGMGCPYNAKRSMLVTLIPDAIDAGARLVHRAYVERLVERGGEIAEAHGRLDSGKRFVVKAKRFVLSGGAINSPGVLLRSGLNDHDLVGRRTFLHPATLSSALFADPVDPFYGAPQSMASHHFSHRGSDMGFFLEATPTHPLLAAGSLPGFGEEQRAAITQLNRSASHVAIHIDGFHPESQGGRVTLSDSGAPLLDYPLEPFFWKAARFSQARLAELAFAGGATKVATLHEPPLMLTSTADIAKIDSLPWRTGSVGVFSAHQMGGCAMGDDAATSVVRSEDLRHHRVRNLYVIDGSVFPTSLGVNPQESIYGLARLMARRLATSTA